MSKRPTNVSVSGELLDQARELDVNLSATLEQALTELIRRHRREQWFAANRDAITAYNEHIEESGVFSDGLRSF